MLKQSSTEAEVFEQTKTIKLSAISDYVFKILKTNYALKYSTTSSITKSFTDLQFPFFLSDKKVNVKGMLHRGSLVELP